MKTTDPSKNATVLKLIKQEDTLKAFLGQLKSVFCASSVVETFLDERGLIFITRRSTDEIHFSRPKYQKS
jgi:hypothetical protein